MDFECGYNSKVNISYDPGAVSNDLKRRVDRVFKSSIIFHSLLSMRLELLSHHSNTNIILEPQGLAATSHPLIPLIESIQRDPSRPGDCLASVSIPNSIERVTGPNHAGLYRRRCSHPSAHGCCRRIGIRGSRSHDVISCCSDCRLRIDADDGYTDVVVQVETGAVVFDLRVVLVELGERNPIAVSNISTCIAIGDSVEGVTVVDHSSADWSRCSDIIRGSCCGGSHRTSGTGLTSRVVRIVFIG